jgi:multidrug efflux pump subunit AcrA (membrane-fusion protein)
MLAVLVIGLLGFIMFGTWDYKVTSEFVLEIESKRIISAPLESDLTAVHVEPGDEVKAGTLLANLNDRELSLQLWKSRAAYNRAEFEKDQFLSDSTKINEYKQSAARMNEAKADIELLEYQIKRAAIKSSIDGVVLQGDWKDKVGGVIKKGDAMFEVASLDEVIAILRVAESDIDQIQEQLQLNQGKMTIGRLATRAKPEIKFDMVIEKIIPYAGPHNNKNVFEVRARLTNPQLWLRPGMEGLAHIEVGKRPIYWIITHRVMDSIRLWLWW